MSGLNIAVEEYTTPNPITATETMTIESIAALMKEHGIRHIPILRGREVVGIVSERDIKLVSGLNLSERTKIVAADIMTPEPVTVSSEAPLGEVAFEMSRRKIGSVIVNEENEFLGIFTVTDALNAMVEIAREDAKSE